MMKEILKWICSVRYVLRLKREDGVVREKQNQLEIGSLGLF